MLTKMKNTILPYLDLIYSFLTGNRQEVERRKLFYQNIVASGELVFDIGANMGNRIEPLVELGARVVAVEPQRRCSRYLKLKYGRKIDVIEKGVSSKAEIKTLYMAKAHVVSTFSTDWMKSLKESGRFEGVDWNNKVEVEMTTLDDLINAHGIPSFIKIDVEGYEVEVLKGLNQPVRALSFEYAVPEQLSHVISCLKLLDDLYGQAEYNYSVGESMEWISDHWMSYEEILNHVQTTKFLNTKFGDIYIRKIW